MNHSSVSIQATIHAEQRGERDTRLHGRRLVLARVFWIVIAIFELGMFAVSLPGFVTQLQTPCTSSCAGWQLSVDAVKQLQYLGFSLGNYVAFYLAFMLISALLSYVIAALLVWRRSNDWMALLVSLMLLGFGPTSNITNTVLLSRWFGPALASSVFNFSNQISITIGVLAFFLFPNGRFVPRWTRWIVILGIGVSIFFIFFPSATQSVISGILYFSVLLGLVIAQVYRYRRVSTPAQRQQTKWVVYSLAVTFILVIGLFGIPSLIFPVLVQNGSLFSSVASFVANALFILLPISFGVAILRYRLWDVDVLINRTLVYGTLTGLLALVYFGLIIGLQYLLRGLINQTNDVAIVISTLAIAALFQPLRRRIQSMIDRRFYRRKYDAVKTLAAFSAPLRNEVDLNQLREQLVAVVEETMQPTFVSLWLRPPTHDGKQRAPWRANLPVSSGER
jgi:hypothetical protein